MIDENEAKIVVRIFTEYVSGRSTVSAYFTAQATRAAGRGVA
ncbi:hypothetical protein ACVME5_006404 [Bradyrhizobium liaoningense]